MSKMAKASQMVLIECKIEKAQEKVVRSKERYDVAVTELKQLMEKKEAIIKGKLMEAITRSDKSYDEILEFLTGGDKLSKAG